MTRIILILLMFLISSMFIASGRILAHGHEIISMTGNGFEPQELTINQGETVMFVNKDKLDRWPASNIHPTHGIYPEFDPKRPLKPNESWSFRFDKAGAWKYHDHLLPHLRGTVTVTGEVQEKKNEGIFQKVWDVIRSAVKNLIKYFVPSSSPSPVSSEPNGSAPTEQFASLDTMIDDKGLEATWQYVIDTYQSDGRNGHDAAHFLGGRIFELKSFEGISICTPTFAFGCYHGFADTALAKNLEPVPKLAKACESVGTINSGPWASCIHGLGHGVGTYFNTTRLTEALAACDTLTSGQTYCHDGVFMEFATSAPKTVYEKTRLDPLYPCDSIDNRYRQACARQQPVVLEKHFGMTFGEITKVCIKSTDQTIRSFCIDALGLLAGQRSNGNPNNIIQTCSAILDQTFFAQCVWAAAGELVFQNVPGWQTAAPQACNSLSDSYKQSCRDRIQQLVVDYARQ